MGVFLSSLEVEPANPGQDDGNWTVTAPLVFQSDTAAVTFTVPAGFVTNFASVPRIPIVYELVGDTSSEAATVHDWLYSTHPVTRAKADGVLREASAATGVPLWRRNLMWLGARVFGWPYWGAAGAHRSMK